MRNQTNISSQNKLQSIQQTLTQSLLSYQQQELNPQITQNIYLNSADLSSKAIKTKNKYQKQYNILQGKSLLSKLLFYWIGPFVSYGNLFEVDQKNIPNLTQNQKSKNQFNKFYNNIKAEQKNQKEGMILAKSMIKTYSKDFIILFIQTFFFIALTMYVPIITHQIISYIEQGTQTKSTLAGILLFVGVYSLTFFKIVAQSHVYYHFGIIGFNLSNTLSLLIYEKSLKHPVLCLKKYSVSQIINYSQVDAQRMTYMGFQLASLLFTPFQVVFGLWLMYQYIGISFLSGVSVMVITIALTFLFSKISIKANDQVLIAKDSRMKVTEQIFSIIRFIKINAFEKYFWQKLNKKRQNELLLNKRKLMFEILTIFVYWLANPLILSVTFTTYIWLGNQMSASKAFTTIMLFRILQYPMKFLPNAISEVIQIWTSMKRIQNFLLSEEIYQKHHKIGNKNYGVSIRILNGNFGWGKQNKQKKNQQKDENTENAVRKKNSKQNQQFSDEEDEELQEKNNSEFSYSSMTESIMSQSTFGSHPKKKTENQKEENQKTEFIKALKDINLQIETGTFTMIIGDIGSGKSSLLYSILNEMKSAKNSMVEINGSIAYVPQKPWIMSGSLRDNITFTLPFEKDKFDQVVRYASMATDLNLLVDGDKTEIGQKGTNLSGGQKARIGLARALYSERDIYLLDDIISAVDVHVGEFLMKQTIQGFLKKKTVVMPTHAVKYAGYADKIIIMKKGRVVRYGTYEEIKDTEQFQQISLRSEKKSKLKKQCSLKKKDKKVIQQLKKLKKSFYDKYQSNQNKQNPAENLVQQLIIPEDRQKGSITLATFKQYIMLNGGWIFLIITFLCMSLWLILTISSNMWMQKWCQDPEQGTFFLYIFLILSISSSFFMLIRAYVLIIGGINCGRVIHKKITKSLLYASLNKFYNRVPMGRIINRLSKDLREIDEAIGYSVGSFLSSLFGLIGTLVICLYASTIFILVPIVVVLYICNKFRLYYMKVQRECVRLQNITSSPIVSGFLSAINGIQTIRAYNLQDNFLQKQIQKVDQNKRLRLSRSALQSWFCQRLAFITFFINMTAIGYCMFSDNENSSFAGLLLTYAITLADDIIDTIFSFTSLQSKMVSVQRVRNFMNIQAEEGYKSYVQKWRTKQQGYKQVIQVGQIQFRNVKVRYQQNVPPVLKGISIKISKGEKVGIVGRTGAGKSTFINCLLRTLDCYQGSIMIDGKDIKDFFVKDLRYNITMIDQQPTLINGTLMQNLDPRNNYSQNQLNQIIDQCHLKEMVDQKGGLKANITNQSLSVGQKQLLCICRAFLKKSKIVLIDEATANIDQKNDQLIQEVIKNKFSKSTVLTIAHRLSTLMKCNKILVLGEGKVIEQGTPEQLKLKEGGIYRQMCQKGQAEQFLS